MDKVDFVCDWETIGTNPDTVVLSLAFTPFKRHESLTFQEYIAQTYYWKFELEHQILMGRTISQDTLDWWDKQDKNVKASQFDPTDSDVSLVEMLRGVKQVCNEFGINNKSMGWARGTSFDFPIFSNIINALREDISKDEMKLNPAFFPCAFWNQRDIRSYIAGLMIDPEITRVPLPKGTLDGFKHHDPIHDCARAILHIKYGEMYAKGEVEIPDEVDENSNK